MFGMRRRDFITLLGGAAACPLAARAQQPAMPVIGFLYAASLTQGYQMTGFQWGLREAGFVEGRNLKIEYRDVGGEYDRLPALAADLVRSRVAVIVASGGSAPALAAKAATTDIPIVFGSGGDPVKTGLVASLNRPGGNVTGVSIVYTALMAKLLDLMHQLVPNAVTIGALVNPKNPDADLQMRELQEAAAAIKQTIHIAKADTEHAIDAAFVNFTEQRATAVLIANDPYFSNRSDQIAALAVHNGLPTIYPIRLFADAGGLMSYGPSLTDAYRQIGIYTGKILRGAKPTDLPVLQPTKFDLVINLKTAKTLGLTVPDKLLALADEVIE
jgi:putative tryptophan/tyrosine transport system substrate-binding protein